MSHPYLDRLRKRDARFGGALEDGLRSISDAITGTKNIVGAGVVPAVTEVLKDPALPIIIRDVNRLHLLEQTPGAPETPGIGLGNVVKPLELYIYTREHKWVVPALLAAALAVPLYIGYRIGRHA